MTNPKIKRRGRPLKGKRKRLRVSFTLDPDTYVWLQNEAHRTEKTASDMLDEVICNYRSHQYQNHESLIKIPLPYQKINNFCQKYHISKLSLFGSVLTKKFADESDIDVLVEFQEGFKPGLFKMIKMQKTLQSLLNGRTVDLKTSPELSPYFREDVLKNAQVIYAQ